MCLPMGLKAFGLSGTFIFFKIFEIGFSLQPLAISISDLNFFITRVFKGVYTLFVYFKRNIYNGHLIT